MALPETPSQSNPERKVIRLVRPSVVVLCGPAACGKSTFAARHFRPTQIISSDHARALVCDDERDQRFNPQAFALVHFLIEQRLSLNRLSVVDSTALTAEARRALLEIARKFQVPAVVLLFDVPLATCLANDQKRERMVGEAVIERQYRLFEQTKAALKDEGFERIIVLKEGDLDTADIEVAFRPLARPPAPVSRPHAAPLPSISRPNRHPMGNRETPGNRRPFIPSRAPAPPRPQAPPAAAQPVEKPAEAAPPPKPQPTPPAQASPAVSSTASGPPSSTDSHPPEV
jgi:protein phosphatase